MKKQNENTGSILLRLIIVLIILVFIAETCGFWGPAANKVTGSDVFPNEHVVYDEENPVRAYHWNREKDELEEVEIYQGNDLPGIMNYIFGGWFEPEGGNR